MVGSAGGKPPLVELQLVEVAYPTGLVALADVSLAVRPDELIVLSGTSGSGKSTCLGVLGERVAATGGAVVHAGDRAAWRRQTASVAQDLRLAERRTVGENIAYGAELAPARPGSPPDVAGIVDRLELGDLLGRFPAELSGGERQRVVLAQALAKQPLLLLADEPTANLDPRLAGVVAEMLARFCSAGRSCVVATHHLGVFLPVADRHLAFPGSGGAPREEPKGSGPC